MEMPHTVWISNEWDIIDARSAGRKAAKELGFNAVDQARIVVTVSELARNIVMYAGKGQIQISYIYNKNKTGLHIQAKDEGPGMNLGKVLKYGYSTSGGFGAGLPGVKRLMDDFTADSSPEEGTTISVTLWLKKSPHRVTK